MAPIYETVSILEHLESVGDIFIDPDDLDIIAPRHAPTDKHRLVLASPVVTLDIKSDSSVAAQALYNLQLAAVDASKDACHRYLIAGSVVHSVASLAVYYVTERNA